MRNQISVFVDGSEYLCTEFYDCDLGGGIEVKDENGGYLGQLYDIEIPDIDDEDATEFFNTVVEEFVDEFMYENF